MHPWEQLERDVGLDRWLEKDHRAASRKSLLLWLVIGFGAVFVAVTPLANPTNPTAPVISAPNGLTCSTDGCRINFGAGASDYIAGSDYVVSFGDGGGYSVEDFVVGTAEQLTTGRLLAPGTAPVPAGSTCLCTEDPQVGGSVGCKAEVKGSTLMVITEREASVRWFCWR